MVWLEASVQGLHILFATFWFGSTLFTDFVLMPAVMGMSPAGQRELGQRIGPITARLEPRAAGATIVLGALRVVLDPHQRCDLIHPRRIRDLFGDHLVETLRGEHLDRVLVELHPVALHLVQRGDLMGPQVVSDLRRG